MRTAVLALCALTCLESAARRRLRVTMVRNSRDDERHLGKGSTLVP